MYFSRKSVVPHFMVLSRFRLFSRIASAIFLSAAAPVPAHSLDVPLTEYTLENGMQVIVIEDHRAPVATHSVWYRVGAADETSGKTGLAHFLEHLLFKGTIKHPYGDFERLMEINGAEGNAFTTNDYTAYYQRVAVNRLPLMMELEADRMQNLVLTDDNVRPELEVVREERRQRIENEPASLLDEQMDAAMYTAHPYGRPVIGWMSEVENLTKDDALRFYRSHYTPANAVLIVAGDVAPTEVKSLAEQYYGVLKNTFAPLPRKRTPEPAALLERRLTMSSNRTPVTGISKSYLTPSYTTQINNDAVALDFLAAIIGSGSQSRFYKSIVLEQKLATEVGSFFDGSHLDNGKFQIYAVLAPGVELPDLEAAIDVIVGDVKNNGVTETEMNRIRVQALAEQVYALDDQSTLLRQAGAAVMTGRTARQAFDTSAWALVTPDDIKRVATTYLQTRNAVVGIMLPE
jgi:zinc protease